MSICWIKTELFFRKKVRGKLVFKIECELREQTNPKQTLHYKSVCTFLRRGDQSISDINIRLHPFSCTRLPTNEICAWLPCYRFQRGPNLPLEIRQLPVSPLFLLLSYPPPSSLSVANIHTRMHTPTHIISYTLLVMYTVKPWAAYRALVAAVGKSCRANCLEQYLKSLDMINNVLRAAVSHQTAHHKHISPGDYSHISTYFYICHFRLVITVTH